MYVTSIYAQKQMHEYKLITYRIIHDYIYRCSTTYKGSVNERPPAFLMPINTRDDLAPHGTWDALGRREQLGTTSDDKNKDTRRPGRSRSSQKQINRGWEDARSCRLKQSKLAIRDSACEMALGPNESSGWNNIALGAKCLDT